MAPLSPLSSRPAAKPSFLGSLWRFSRPHTVIGTSLSVWGIAGMTWAIAPGNLSPLGLVVAMLGMWLACLGGNVYIVGLNQLTDVAIDRINKPNLPLASGAFSRRQGQWIVGIAGVGAIALASLQGPYLLGVVGLSMGIGTAYSLPPLRFKRFPFWAAFCIFSVRGIIVNLGLFLHGAALMEQGLGQWSVLGPPPAIPPVVWALTGFILVYTVAIALFKDIPDGEGDRRYHIQTLTLRLGGERVFQISRWLITACYASMILVGLGLPAVHRPFFVLSHALALGIFWWQSQGVNLAERSQITRCYQLIWKLFFVEYLILPIACWLVAA